MRLRSSSCFQPDNVGMAQKPSAKHALLGINGSDGGADAIPSQLDALVPGSLWPHRRHTLSALLVPTGVAPGTETGAYEGDILGHIAKNLQLRSPMDLGQHLLHTAERTVCDQVWRIVRTRKDWQVLAHNDRVFAHLEWQITRGGTQGRTTDRTVYSHGRRRKIGCASCAPLSRPRRSQSCRGVYAGGSRARRIRGGPSCCRRCWRPAAPWATLPPARRTALVQRWGIPEAAGAGLVGPAAADTSPSDPPAAVPDPAPLGVMTAPHGASSVPKILRHRRTVLAASKKARRSNMSCAAMPC